MRVKTKIICTLGPACQDITVLRKMMQAGMDVARLNFSHGTHAEHAERIRMVRELNRKYRRRVLILQDLEGYRIRLGRFPKGHAIPLRKKQTVYLTPEGGVTGGSIPFDYDGPLEAIHAGSQIYIDDGNIVLKAGGVQGGRLRAEVVVPGVLKERKGINIPDIRLKFRGLKAKDRRDLDFGVSQRVDLIAQSFVRGPEDVLDLRRYLAGRLPHTPIIAKIENRSGIERIDEILKVSDGIMIARGDMGVSVPIFAIPMIQKMIIRKCNRYGMFAITATQMLESMTANPRPTRAEVTDVANAILDGTDYVMLSGETAAGRYPVESVQMMNQIIRYTEQANRLELRF